MALTHEKVVTEAQAIKSVCDLIAAALSAADEILEHNSDLSIDWAAGATPAYITEDGDGNISGLTFTRQQVANAVGSLDQFRNLLTNQAVSQGDHLGNVNQLASPNQLRVRVGN